MEHGVYYYLLAPLLPLVYFLVKSSWKKAPWGSGSRHGLELPPGPWQLPVIGSIHHLRGTLVHRALRDLSLRHGPLMFLRFGEVPVVVASTPDAARQVMKTHDAIFASRPLRFATRRDGVGIVWAPNGDHWRQLRKVCVMELLSARRVLSLRPARAEEALRLARAVASASSSTAAGAGAGAAPPPPLVDLGRMVAVYVADASLRGILGRRFKVEDRDTLLRYLDEGVRLAGSLAPTDLFPSSWLVRALSRRAVREVEAYRQSLSAFMDGVVLGGEHLERRRSRSTEEEKEKEEDLIDVLLRIQKEGNLQFPLTTRIIKAVILDLIGGGIETATTTLQWAMAELMRNPGVMCKAQAEVRRVFMAAGGETKVTEDRLGELPYLQLVIKETLRLHVPGPLLRPRECQEECRVLGYDVPRGAMVLVNAWAIARSPNHWEEPDAFHPERFAAAGDGGARDFRGNDFEFIPFGAGRRICPWVAFGLANVELGLASLLFYFDWSLPEGVVPGEMDMTETMGITARRKADLLLSATPRVKLPS